MQQRLGRRHGPLPSIPIVLSIEERGALEHLFSRAILLAADG